MFGLHQSTALHVSGLVRESKGPVARFSPGLIGVARLTQRASNLLHSLAVASARVGANKLREENGRRRSVGRAGPEVGVKGEVRWAGRAKGTITGEVREGVGSAMLPGRGKKG